MLTFEQIKELIEQVAERRLQGVEIERSGFRLKIEGQAVVASASTAPSRTPGEPRAVASSEMPVSTASPPSEASKPAGEAMAVKGDEGPSEGANVIRSPIVGTFYRRPSPEADAYVKVGDRVHKGQVLCIVEAMKLMNEIESELDGEILEIYPENAQPVEYGEPLFAIKPD